MNSVILIGRLTHDPNVEYVGNNTARCKFRLAVDRENKKGEADFLNCTVFGKQAETLASWKHKGDMLGVQGRIETGSYKKQDGTTVYTTDIICSRVEFISAGRNEGGQGGQQRQYAPPQREQYEPQQYNSMPPKVQAPNEDIPAGFQQSMDDIPF